MLYMVLVNGLSCTDFHHDYFFEKALVEKFSDVLEEYQDSEDAKVQNLLSICPYFASKLQEKLTDLNCDRNRIGQVIKCLVDC